MNIQALSLSLTAIILVLCILPILIGLIKGFKKSLPDAITNLVLCIGLLIIVPIVAKNLINADLSSWNVDLNGHATIKDYLLAEINNLEGMQGLIESCPSIESLITELPFLITTPILFTLFFWGFKIILFVIGLIVGLIRLIVKAFTKKKPKAKAHHGFGALIGLASSLVLLFATFMPIFGFCGICNQLNSLEVQASNSDGGTETVSTILSEGETETPEEKTTLFTQMFGKDATAYLEMFNNNAALKVVKYTGVGPLSDATFNGITSTKINDTEVHLVDEVNSIFNIYSEISYFSTFSFDKATQAEIDDALNRVLRISNLVFDMKTVSVAGNEFIPYMAKSAQDETSIFYIPKQDNENINDIIVAALNSLSDYQVKTLKDNIQKMVELTKILNDNGLITGFRDANLNNDKPRDNAIEFIKIFDNTKADFADSFSKKFFEISILEDIAPTLVNSSVAELFKSLDLEFTKDSIQKQDAIDYLTKLMAGPIKIMQSLSIDEEFFLTKDSFEISGQLLDDLTTETIISKTAYDKLIEKIQTELTDYVNKQKTTEGTGIFDDGNLDVTYNISSLSDIKSATSNFRTEMAKFYDVYRAISNLSKEVKEAKDTETWLKTTDMVYVGEMFDSLEKTIMFKNINELYNGALNFASKNYPDFTNSVNSLKLNSTELSSDINWTKEIPAVKPLAIEIYKYSKNAPEFTDTVSMVQIIDVVSAMSEVESNENSTVYSSKMEPLLLVLLNDAQHLASSSDVDSLIVEINSAINNRTTESLEKTVVRGIVNYAKTFVPSQETIDSITDEKVKATIQTFIDDLDKILVEENVDYVKEIKKLFSVASKISTITNLSEATKEEIVDVVIDAASDYINNLEYEDNVGLIDAITNNKQELIDNVDLETVAGELDTLIDSAETILSESNKLTDMNVESVSNALDTIRNSESFSDNVTNIIFDKMLDAINQEIQDPTNYDYSTEQKEIIGNIIEANKVSGKTVQDGDYQNILTEIFNTINANKSNQD